VIETLIKQIVEKVPPSANGNLEGFITDLDHAFWKAKKVIAPPNKFLRTNQPRQLLVVRASIAESVKALPIVFQTIKAVWASVTYRYFEASSLDYYQEALVLRFVTVMSDEELFVSGAIIIEGQKYQKLIIEHESKFGKTVETLPSIKILGLQN
jgi:hypothetical protein